MISNYNELVTSIAKELEREDLLYMVPEWIQLAEASLGRFIKLIDGEQVTTGATVIDEATITFPIGFKRAEHIELQDDPLRVLNIVSWDKRSDVLINDLSGRPRTITYLGRVGYLAPVPKNVEAYTLFYYGKPPPLGEDQPSNDLLEMGPDVLKYEALKYSAPWLMDDERLLTWEALLTPARTLLKKEYWDSHAGGGILRVRPDFAPGDSHDQSSAYR